MKKSIFGGLFAAGFALAQAAGVGQVGSMGYEWTGLKGTDSLAHNLVDMRGKVVLVFSLQYFCGGCKANAPRIGQIAKKYQGKNFQAIGIELTQDTYKNLYPNDMTFYAALKQKADSVNFPILIGVPGNQITSASAGIMWTQYDCYRDVYFVIDGTGKISTRMDGNRGGITTEANFTSLDNGIAQAIAGLTTNLITSMNSAKGLGLKAFRQAGRYQIQIATNAIRNEYPSNLQILDSQGRLIKSYEMNSVSQSNVAEFLWNGTDNRGQSVAYGNYFLNAAGHAGSVTLLLPWLP